MKLPKNRFSKIGHGLIKAGKSTSGGLKRAGSGIGQGLGRAWIILTKKKCPECGEHGDWLVSEQLLETRKRHRTVKTTDRYYDSKGSFKNEATDVEEEREIRDEVKEGYSCGECAHSWADIGYRYR